MEINVHKFQEAILAGTFEHTAVHVTAAAFKKDGSVTAGNASSRPADSQAAQAAGEDWGRPVVCSGCRKCVIPCWGSTYAPPPGIKEGIAKQ